MNNHKTTSNDKDESFNINLTDFPFVNLKGTTPQKCGQSLLSLFNSFKNSSDSSKCQKISIDIMENLNITKDDPLFKAVSLVSQKFDQGLFFKENNLYHNLQHSIEVSLMAYHLCILNNSLLLEPSFSDREIAIIILAALLHDINHDGYGNRGQDFKLEQLAFNHAQKLLNQTGVSQEEQKIIEALILSTDINCFAELSNKIIKYYTEEAKLPKIPDNMKKLELFLNNKKAFRMALIIDDADLIPSTALDIEKTKALSQNIYYEQTKDNFIENNPKVTNLFLSFSEHFLGKGFKSSAGKFYNQNLKTIATLLK